MDHKHTLAHAERKKSVFKLCSAITYYRCLIKLPYVLKKKERDKENAMEH